jgi:hypothetical protein
MRKGPAGPGWPRAKPECYVGYGLDNVTIGGSTGALGTGSLAFNDLLLNGGTTLQLGTGTTLRLGKHVYFTRLVIRCYVNNPALGRIRVIVGKNNRESTIGNAATNAALTALIEGADYLESPQQGSVLSVDKYIAPSCDYTILSDIMLGGEQAPVNQTTVFPVELIIPLNLKRTYDQSNNIDQGSFFVYMVATSAPVIYGYIRAEYVNCWNFEDVANTVGKAALAADRIYSSLSNSIALKALLTAFA